MADLKKPKPPPSRRVVKGLFVHRELAPGQPYTRWMRICDEGPVWFSLLVVIGSLMLLSRWVFIR